MIRTVGAFAGTFLGATTWIGLVLAATMPVVAEQGVSDQAESVADRAAEILEATGVRGGLIVHLGCGDGRLTAAWAAHPAYRVHGLDRDPDRVRDARQYVQDQGVYGRVAIDVWDGSRLPYTDNLVNLAVFEDADGLCDRELDRVLAPLGVAYIHRDGQWVLQRQPWPEEIDEWTHYLHSSNNNAVGQDVVAGPPHHLQWRSGPNWLRSHEHLSSFSAMVSAGGRVFAILDQGLVASVAFPARWQLVARDAFSGVRLWSVPLPRWESRFRSFRSGPPHLARRLVAHGDRVYVTLGYGEPVSVLDAASGELVRVYPETAGAEEIVLSEGVLYTVIGDAAADEARERAVRRGEPASQGKSLVAVQADSGELLWKCPAEQAGYILPTTLAVADGNLVYQNADQIVCRDAVTGQPIWQTARPLIRLRPTWLAPTLVLQDGVVLSSDRNEAWIQRVGLVDDPPGEPGQVLWDECSMEAYREANAGRQQALLDMQGTLYAYSAASGELLWQCPVSETFNAPPDVLVSRGLVWTSRIVCASQPGITEGRNLQTGAVEFTRPADQEFYTVGMGHGRCHRSFGTVSYLITGRAGVELVDLDSGDAAANHWLRGACQYGFMPSNGLLYVPPHPCACYIEAKINGFNAMAPRRETSAAVVEPGSSARLVRGPAWDTVPPQEPVAGGWPTYRRDAARSGRAGCAVSPELETRWQVDLTPPLTSPVMAAGHVLVAAIDTHTLHALDADSGESVWSFTAAGRIDSPPTFDNGRVLFGSADGWVYCLRATDGELVWRFQAAPEIRWIMNQDQLESAWPVHGSVLVQDGIVYFVAGRSSYVDGGMHLYGLETENGELVFHRHLSDWDPETGLQPYETIRGTRGLPGVLPDILSSDGDSLFMRHQRYDLNGRAQPNNVPHLYSSVGFLDADWWHRTYWILGTETGSGFGGWPRPGKQVPSGRILVRTDSDVYGFGRNAYRAHGPGGGGHAGLGGVHYELFATQMKDNGKHDPRWSIRPPFWVRAMVVDDQHRVFAAGPPVERYLTTSPLEDVDDPDMVSREQLGPWYGEYFPSLRNPEEALEAFQGQKGSLLWVLDGNDGERLAAYDLPSTPVFDGLIAAAGKLFLTTGDGQVLCLEARQ